MATMTYARENKKHKQTHTIQATSNIPRVIASILIISVIRQIMFTFFFYQSIYTKWHNRRIVSQVLRLSQERMGVNQILNKGTKNHE